jgi:hypothetical protein
VLPAGAAESDAHKGKCAIDEVLNRRVYERFRMSHKVCNFWGSGEEGAYLAVESGGLCKARLSARIGERATIKDKSTSVSSLVARK